jgi:hypothetical protein
LQGINRGALREGHSGGGFIAYEVQSCGAARFVAQTLLRQALQQQTLLHSCELMRTAF